MTRLFFFLGKCFSSKIYIRRDVVHENNQAKKRVTTPVLGAGGAGNREGKNGTGKWSALRCCLETVRATLDIPNKGGEKVGNVVSEDDEDNNRDQNQPNSCDDRTDGNKSFDADVFTRDSIHKLQSSERNNLIRDVEKMAVPGF